MQAQLPNSLLGYHRILSPSAAVRVSPLCLGAMNFGEAWKAFMGECSKDTVFEILDYFYDQGGNFIDTANGYQDEQSEEWIGEWMEARGVRDQMVIATKYTSACRRHLPGIQSNYTGNNTKSMFASVDASLKKLKTSYIDVLYLHWWDFTASIPEVMKSLNTLADQGKVLYLGVSDTPAWIVSKANQWARDHGLRQFVVYQGRWSAADRDFEREIIPMCEAEGMGLAPWGALGGGDFKTEQQRKEQGGRNMAITGRPPNERAIEVAKVLEKVAERKGSIITSVALAYVMHKTPNVFPIVGGRKIDHLKGNIEALSLRLSKEDIEEIEAAYPFSIGFPLNFLFSTENPGTDLRGDNVWLTKMSTYIDVVERPKPIQPREKA
ncbi:Putative NADP-dependent oxidoreductase domain-containing protein [Septoria linicola]|uniref:NADP-dependent oxidoreductase domain-containing protein n=1 Tax=Septoria linicola TaxID=215465 RepID=A0A9Q9B582_9PEZI|nr:putative NADP-dependent oxidoreductase domain-containing protein [Septoria linicola]USW57381.1 Putative NADP-dependent oxidoreductase domain-containing protein [Septoria linicola]